MLKSKIILQFSKEVEQASSIAEKDILIAGFKAHCPDCWKSYMKKNGKEA